MATFPEFDPVRGMVELPAGKHAVCGICGGLKELIVPVVNGVTDGRLATIFCPTCDLIEA